MSKRIMKLRTSQGMAKRLEFPENFDKLMEIVKNFFPIDTNTKSYQLIDENLDREIHGQEDYELMNKKYQKGTVKVLIKEVYKEEPLIINPSSSKVFNNNDLVGETVNISILSKNQKKEIDEEEDPLKKDIQELVRNKMKDLEVNIVQDIYQSIKSQLTLNEQNQNLNQNEMVHKGIKCNHCGVENIKGIRYKCLQCNDFNLCGGCEESCDHDPAHILIKIRKPLNSEYELLFKEDKNLRYKNGQYNYCLVNSNEIKFDMDKKRNNLLSKQITLKNIGEEAWKAGGVFRCLPDSQLKGDDFPIGIKVNKGDTINLEIIFNDFKERLLPCINEYNVYYQMFNSNNEAFGNITKFKVIFQN